MEVWGFSNGNYWEVVVGYWGFLNGNYNFAENFFNHLYSPHLFQIKEGEILFSSSFFWKEIAKISTVQYFLLLVSVPDQK